ncbi:MAG: FGGY-family carbohydrate kinase [Sphaerochaeta sp.]
MTVLVLEASTSSAKAMVIDTDTSITNSVVKPFTLQQSNNALKILDLVLQAGREVLAGHQSIDAIALGSTWHGLLLCDDLMNPISPLWTWADGFADSICKNLRKNTRYTQDFYMESGCTVHASYPFFKLKHLLQTNQLTEQYRIADQGSHIFHALTGQWATSLSMASGTGFLNLNTRSYSRRVYDELGLDQDRQLPALQDRKYSAPLTSHAATLLGVQSGIPVLPCYPDGGLNQVGSGALEGRIMTLSMGTSGAMRLSVTEPKLSPTQSTWCYLSPKGYLAGAATSGCSNCVQWAKERLFATSAIFEEIEAPVRASNAVPIFLPFLFGERSPGWDAARRGGFLNLHASHSAQDQYQAVLEGVIYNLKQCYSELQKSAGPIDTIKLSGGVLHSGIWSQMCTDILGAPLAIDASVQSSLMGGAILALELLGDKMPSTLVQDSGRTIYPNEEVHDLYQRRFEEYLYWYEKTASY